MTDHPVLVSRQPAVPIPRTEELDVELRRAKALSLAGDVLPRAYRDRPGAILLADQWARARGIDTLTAIQTVSFIDGRPVIDATMQRALAQRAGYRILVAEATNDRATVVVSDRNGEVLGRETFTMADARAAELSGKANWKKNPRNMLVARATTNAIRFHAPEVLIGLSVADVDDVEPIADPVVIMRPAPIEPEPIEAEIVGDTLPLGDS
jgi:hypothetical protein